MRVYDEESDEWVNIEDLDVDDPCPFCQGTMEEHYSWCRLHGDVE